ncbi:uncharacterized protein BYT42DRAFT_93749 [Radiomyces spectabilis]|uniref:uncharacterized protein n=1 Tax=Radiomyces spectabilis TaxID=64574 RepID=UPI00221EB195|nr:uncharacterized protein BYT42DRAFT_93749 [Radiomyces spectabilis]KAI8370566.1 hypothetical protein BYT42DRAFT_93749 [Radiomyces spectabilis]
MASLSAIHIFPVKSCHYVQVEECKVHHLGLENDRRFMLIDERTGRFISQRKYSSMILLRPVIDLDKETLSLTSDRQAPLVLPLHPDTSALQKRSAQLWKNTLTVFDLGDEAAAWLSEFFQLHRDHDIQNSHNPDDPVKDNDSLVKARLVYAEDPKKGVYQNPAHVKLPGVHSPFTDWSPISFGCEASLDAMNTDLVNQGISQGAKIPLIRFRNNISISGTTPWEEENWLVVKIGEVTFYVIRPIARCTVPGVDQDTGIKDSWGGPTPYLVKHRQFAEKPNEGRFCVDVVPLTSGTIHVGDKVQVLERIPTEYQQQPVKADQPNVPARR